MTRIRSDLDKVRVIWGTAKRDFTLAPQASHSNGWANKYRIIGGRGKDKIFIFWFQFDKESIIMLLFRTLPNSKIFLFVCVFEPMDVDCILRNSIILSLYSTQRIRGFWFYEL